MVKLRSKEMWSVPYVTCVDIVAQVFLSWWSVFLLLDLPTLKLKIIINILPTDWSKIFFRLPVQQKIKLPSPYDHIEVSYLISKLKHLRVVFTW